eukprot:861623-Prymnesium_polylepis.1
MWRTLPSLRCAGERDAPVCGLCHCCERERSLSALACSARARNTRRAPAAVWPMWRPHPRPRRAYSTLPPILPTVPEGRRCAFDALCDLCSHRPRLLVCVACGATLAERDDNEDDDTRSHVTDKSEGEASAVRARCLAEALSTPRVLRAVGTRLSAQSRPASSRWSGCLAAC